MCLMPNKPSLSRLFELHNFLQEMHYVNRVVHHPKFKDRQETDTEHSYTLAMFAWYLASFFPDLDRDKCIRLALAHDIVEIYAGDTFLYGKQEELDTKATREKEALNRIKKEWSDFGQMTEAISEYEAKQTQESCFVYALDKIMPIFMIFLGEGHTWKKENITLEMLITKKEAKVALSPEINYYFEELIKLLKVNDHYFPSQ